MDTSKDKPVVISAENFNKKNVFKFSIVNPKFLGLLSVLLLLVGGVGTGVYLTRSPNQTVTQATLTAIDISFIPQQIQTETGSSFNIDVFGNANGNQITGVTLALKYDPDVLTLQSITPKQFLPKVVIAPNLASGSASVSLGTDGNSGITGSGVIATLGFLVNNNSSGSAPIQSGSTQIEFENGKTIVNALGNPSNLVGNLKPANITINPASANQPPLPTNTPASSSASIPVEFDFNSDNQINSIDLSVLYSAWGEPETAVQRKADINGDGIVNGLDYARLLPQLKR